MEDRFNTIAGWVLFAGIVALATSIVAGEALHSERPEKMGYPIEGVEETGGGAGAAEKPIESYLATADATKGGDVFKKCAACHNADKGGPNMTGPNLWDVLGQPIGQGKGGFAFSDAVGKKGGNWDWHSLSDWLTSPKTFAPGTKMTFAGLSNPQDRANVIAFLNQHSDAPLPIPAAPAAGASDTAQKDAGTKPGTGPNNGPQKADKEPVLKTGAATETNPKNSGGDASPAGKAPLGTKGGPAAK